MSYELFGQSASEIAKSYGIPVPIFNSVITQESNWNPRALGTSDDRGLMQLTPLIRKAFNAGDGYDPNSNMIAGAKLLVENFKRDGNWRDALARYNAGGGAQPNQAGFKYADQVLKRAGIDNKNWGQKALDFGRGILSGKSVVQILGEEAVDKTKEIAGGKIEEGWEWIKSKFGTKLVLVVVIILLLYLAITRLIK